MAKQVLDVVYFEYAKPPVENQTVYVWDIDKTYLDTHFDTLRGLIKTAFEKAFQKRNVPGTATLIRALESSQKSERVSVYFISASPPQMEQKLYQKMGLDHIKPLGIFFKDNLKNIRPSKFRRLKQQVGFKIQALLELRVKLPENVKMVLFGDDSESDAVVYSLFSDICKRRIKLAEILSLLEALHVLPEQRNRIVNLQAQIAENDPVEKIYINLVADTDPEYYAKFGRRVLATFTSFQAALDLYQDGRIDENSLVQVGRDMLSNYGFTPEELSQNFDDLQKRTFLKTDVQNKILPRLKKENLVPEYFMPLFRPKNTLKALGEKILGLDLEEPWVPDHIDYLNDFR